MGYFVTVMAKEFTGGWKIYDWRKLSSIQPTLSCNVHIPEFALMSVSVWCKAGSLLQNTFIETWKQWSRAVERGLQNWWRFRITVCSFQLFLSGIALSWHAALSWYVVPTGTPGNGKYFLCLGMLHTTAPTNNTIHLPHLAHTLAVGVIVQVSSLNHCLAP